MPKEETLIVARHRRHEGRHYELAIEVPQLAELAATKHSALSRAATAAGQEARAAVAEAAEADAALAAFPMDLDEDGRVVLVWSEAIPEVPVDPANPTKGTKPAYKTRKEYEDMQLNVAAGLIRHHLAELERPQQQAGTKASGEGKKL